MTKAVSYGKISKTLYGKEIEKNLAIGGNVFVTSFSKVSSNALTDLRKNLKKQKTRYFVVKNTLAQRAVKTSPLKVLSSWMTGECGVAITSDDIAKVSKIFLTFSEEQAGFKIQGAYIEGQVFSSEMVKALANLPPREELLSKMLGGLQAPIQGFVSVLNQVLGGFVNVLNEIRKSRESKS